MLNNKTYLPFLIHQLPKNYNKFNTLNILKINTTIYICQLFVKQQT